MARCDTSEPLDISDRLLWRDAQRLLSRHTQPDRGGCCVWCGSAWPCPPRRLAERAEAVVCRPWHGPWPIARQRAGAGDLTGADDFAGDLTGDRVGDTSRWADLVDYASHPR